MFVVVSTETVGPSEIEPLIPAHLAWVEEQYAAGRLLVSGPRDPDIGGVFVVRADDEEELRQLLAGDPLTANGAQTVEVFAFGETEFPRRSAGFDAFMRGPASETGRTR
jgi:uncharacterized protein YciI